MKEEVFLFGGTRSLVGIITDPPNAVRGHKAPAIIFLNAGTIHRVGPNRVYVNMARRLAAMGCVVCRFDFSGIGDSKAREDVLPFEQGAVSEVQEAISALREARGVERVILVGLCTGAVIAFHTVQNDPRITGIIMINSQHYGSEWLHAYIKDACTVRRYAKDMSHWRKKAFCSPASWVKVLTGKVNYKAHYRRVRQSISFLMTFHLIRRRTPRRKISGEVTHILQDMHVLADRNVRLLLVFSGGGMDAEYLKILFGGQSHDLNSYRGLTIKTVPHTDSFFTSLSSQNDLFRLIQEWIQSMDHD